MNSIHPSAQIIGDVRLGEGNMIGPLVVIIGPVSIGSNNWIGTGAVIGAPPEVRDWKHPSDAESLSSGGGIEIGEGNVIREYVQVHQGWHDVTRVGSDTFIMNRVYVAHDCQVEDGATIAGGALLAGHVRVGRTANVGLGASVHQRRYVADGAMIGMGSVVTRDVPPFAKAYGNPARVRGVNRIGMQRSGISDAAIDALAAAYSEPEGARDLAGLEADPDLASALGSWRQYSTSSTA